MSCYRRDYDFLGYRYALMSQLATAGLNNVLCMIPARDEAEFSLFPQEDIAFIKGWLTWTDSHIAALRNTVPLPGLDEVGIGLIDGTAAFNKPLSCGSQAEDDEPLGYIWLFNPTYRAHSAEVILDASLSPFDECLYAQHGASPTQQYDLVETYRTGSPATTGTMLASAGYGQKATLHLDGSSCLMVSVHRHKAAENRQEPAQVEPVWRHAQDVKLEPRRMAPDGNVSYFGTATVPSAVYEQLRQRAQAYPIQWDATDADASWLQPQRLLLFLQLNCTTGRSGACDDSMPATLLVANKTIPGLKAYETRCTACTNANHPNTPRRSQRFNGWYWDVSGAFPENTATQVEVRIPQAFAHSVVALAFENTDTVLARA